MCGSEKKIVTNSAFLRRKRIWDEKKGRFLVFLYNASIQGVSYCNGRNEMALRDTRVTNFVESWCLMTVQKEHEPNRARTKKGTNQKQHQPNRARTKKSTNQIRQEPKRARTKKGTNQKGHESKTARTK